jgi:hypothetical protein
LRNRWGSSTARPAQPRRLPRALAAVCFDFCPTGGLPKDVVRSDAATIAEALNSRFPGDWRPLAEHLNQAAEARYQSLAPRSAFALVKALDHDLKSLADLTTRAPQPQAL